MPASKVSRETIGTPLANARHERFAQLVVSGLPQSRAYIEAGYAARGNSAEASSSALVRDPKIVLRMGELRGAALERVQAANAPAEDAAIGSAAWIIEKAGEVVNRALDAVPVRDSKGHIIEGEWTCNLGAATPALALLSKLHPEFSEKHEISGDLRLRVEALAAVAHMSPDEMKALAARARS